MALVNRVVLEGYVCGKIKLEPKYIKFGLRYPRAKKGSDGKYEYVSEFYDITYWIDIRNEKNKNAESIKVSNIRDKAKLVVSGELQQYVSPKNNQRYTSLNCFDLYIVQPSEIKPSETGVPNFSEEQIKELSDDSPDDIPF